MYMFNGELVTPANETAPTIESVGVGLGRIPRFGGQTRDWYPVLAHVLVCGKLSPDPEYTIHLLLHDAPEVCVSDVPTPWKTEAARKRESMILRRIYRTLDLEWPIPDEVEAVVKEIDAKVLAAEAHALGHPVAHYWPEYDRSAYIETQIQMPNARLFQNPEISQIVYRRAVEAALAKRSDFIVIG